MVRNKQPAKRSIEVPSSSSQPLSQRRRHGPIIAPIAGFQDLPASFFPSLEHRLRFQERFRDRQVHHGKDVNSSLLLEVGFWDMDLAVNGVGFMHSLPKDVCELAVRLFYCNLTDDYANGQYHIGFKYKRNQRKSNVLYSNVFGQHIELSLTRLAEFLNLQPGGLDIDQPRSYDIRQICSILYGDQHNFSGNWAEMVTELGVNALSPLAWVLHVWVINNYSPRQARGRLTMEELWLLGCLIGNIKINYPLWLCDLFRKAATHSRFILPLGRLITHILTGFGIQFPPASLTVKTIEEFSTTNMKKAGFQLIRLPSGEKSWIRKTAAPPQEDDDEATEDDMPPGHDEDTPMTDPVPPSTSHSTPPHPHSSMDELVSLVSDVRSLTLTMGHKLDTVIDHQRGVTSHLDRLDSRVDRLELSQAYQLGISHQHSMDIHGLYQHHHAPYPPPDVSLPSGYYPPPPPPGFYPYPPPPPPSDE